MKDNFWQKLKATHRAEGKPFFVLAPMADVTDMAFRQIIIECGRPDVFYTEFVSVAGLCYLMRSNPADAKAMAGKAKLLPHLKFKENERPIVAQVFGSNPAQFYEVAKLVCELGFDGIDINMGCPDKKIMKQGAGISLCKRPELALEIIAETRRGVESAGRQIPVSVKTRLGLDEIDMSWIKKIIDVKPDALLVHLRTMKEMSKGLAHWELAKEIADMAHERDVPIIGNGDVVSYSDGLEKAKQSGMDGIMVGRGIFHNPWFFNPHTHSTEFPSGEASSRVSVGVNPEVHTPQERINLLKSHIKNFVELWGPSTGSLDSVRDKSGQAKNFDVMKRFIKVYINDFEGAKGLRDTLMKMKTAPEVLEHLLTLDYIGVE